MQIALNRYSAQPLYLQIVHEVQRQISSGALPPGARLPTVRELARQLDINYLTVHSAYSQLQSAGWLKSTVGRGTFVAPRDAPPDVAGLGRELSARGLLSDMLRLSRTSGIHSLAAAEPAPELVPSRELERAVAEALKRGAQGLVTVDPQGDPRLRAALAALLAERGVKVSAEELLVTSGATQGLALVARALTQPGDTVLVEEPTGLSALNTLGMLGLRLVGAPVDADGLALEALEVLILAHRPRFLYIAPTFHGPGAPLSQVRRAALLTLAARYRLPVVEDDVYGLLSYDGPALAPLKAEDADGLVVYLSSFSKVLLPGVRIGYVAARAELIEQLSLAKQADDLGSSPLLQRALAIIMRRGWFAAHLRRALPIYRERR
ncbi:MAG: hypothetical protein RLZZ387_3195, partial [Chloroflexota bacterium]